jgi:hypothetical protein
MNGGKCIWRRVKYGAEALYSNPEKVGTEVAFSTVMLLMFFEDGLASSRDSTGASGSHS